MAGLIDVLVDLNNTLVSTGGDIKFPCLVGSFCFAHGALEFLAALDRIPGVRIGFYSCGKALRNANLLQALSAGLEDRLGYKISQEIEVFSVRPGKKKSLHGLREGLDLERAILIDDTGRNSAMGEERNLVKIYHKRRLYDEEGKLCKGGNVFKARIANNLVRALGLLLKSIESSSSSKTLVQALESLQWNGDEYLHESSNSEEIYRLGLEAMRGVRPEFSIKEVVSSVDPWSPHERNEELFPSSRSHLLS